MKIVRMDEAKPGVVVGIDLGTSNSLVAILRDGRVEVLDNALGEKLTPSVVSLDDDGNVLVGSAAQARLASHPEQSAALFKRDMGTDRQVALGARRMRPEELSALVLESLKRDAEAALGEPVSEAIVTVPAYFGDRQRQATRDAGAIAGIKVERIINEPTAAALAYGLHNSDKEVQVLVLDLGGGTFDVTVLDIIEGVIEIQSTAGDSRLGGEDFVDMIRDRVMEQSGLGHLVGAARKSSEESGVLARVRNGAERAKRLLSTQSEARISVPKLMLGGREHSIDESITRDEAEALWQPLLKRLRGPIRRAIRDANLTPQDIDEVLLVGGATRMPCVVNLAAEIFGRPPLDALPADEAVAIGAAIQAALKQGDQSVEDMVVTDVAPFTMGIASSTRMGRQLVDGLFSPILERGTTIPASRSSQFFTMEAGQQVIDVAVYQGEHSLCKNNTLLGTYTIKGLARAPAGESGVDVRFTYDLNGILEVEMKVLGTERVEHLVLEQTPGKLNPREIETARKSMAGLKFHPRDTLPNRTLLAKGDELFAETRGDTRDHVAAALASFRAALEHQDPELIRECAANLRHVIDVFSRR